MKIRNFYLVFLVIFASIFQPAFPNTDSGSDELLVEEISLASIEEKIVKSSDIWLISFYDTISDVSNKFISEYKKSSSLLKGVVKFASIKVKSKEEKKLSKYNIISVPALVMFGLDKSTPVVYDKIPSAFEVFKFATSMLKLFTKQRLSLIESEEKERDKEKHEALLNQLGVDRKASDKIEYITPDPKYVVKLTDKNFDDNVINSQEVWIVRFCVPWNSKCQDIETNFIFAAYITKEKVKFGFVDASSNPKTLKKFPITEYPYIIIIKPMTNKYNDVLKYDGSTSFEDITNTAMAIHKEFGLFAEINQLTSQEQFDAECGNTSCFILFLPNIYDSQAEGRRRYIETARKASVVLKGKSVIVFWAQAGDFFEFEEKLGISFGFPAILLINIKKQKYSTMVTSYETENIREYFASLVLNKEKYFDTPVNLPKLKKAEKWDGKDMSLDISIIEDL